MTNQQPKGQRPVEALRLAEWLDGHSNGPLDNKHNAAAELRRLHRSEREGWRYADELEQERKRLHEVNQMLLDAITKLMDTESYWWQEVNEETIDRLKAVIAKAGEA